MRYLALDVGDRRVGVAISDEEGLIATPLTVIRRASKVEDFSRILQLLQELGARGLVVGHPRNIDGSATAQARRIERYVAALTEALRADGLDIPIIFWDESLSTQRAQELMVLAGRKASDRRARVDAVAAAVILQEFLDTERPTLLNSGEEETS